LFTSAVPGNASPASFYEHYGFVRTGEIFDDEIVLRLDIERETGRRSPPGAPGRIGWEPWPGAWAVRGSSGRSGRMSSPRKASSTTRLCSLERGLDSLCHSPRSNVTISVRDATDRIHDARPLTVS
jgi:hypothetical protein